MPGHRRGPRSARQRLGGRRPPALPLPLRSEHLLLRLPRESDVGAWYRILTRPEVLALMQPESRWDRRGVLRKIRIARRDYARRERYELTVEELGTGRVLGRVALKDVEPIHRRAEVAYWFDPDRWGEGLAREAVHRLCSAGFDVLGLHRIDARIYAFNRRSQRLARSLGFRREGVLRGAFLGHQGWQDAWVFGLLRGELRPPG